MAANSTSRSLGGSGGVTTSAFGSVAAPTGTGGASSMGYTGAGTKRGVVGVGLVVGGLGAVVGGMGWF